MRTRRSSAASASLDAGICAVEAGGVDASFASFASFAPVAPVAAAAADPGAVRVCA